ncbi:hypothetical protein OROGR_032356 [Orobanche gracilis]
MNYDLSLNQLIGTIPTGVLSKNITVIFLSKPRKLKVIPKQYEGIVKQEYWKTFVEWRLSPEFKVIIVYIAIVIIALPIFFSPSIDVHFYLRCNDVSKASKQARAKAKYPHRLGRLGYSGLREKLVKSKELVKDEDNIPVRSVMWRKARQTKDGEYKDDDVRNVANEIVTIHHQLPWFL